MLTVICARYLHDGSFWIDEASVALSFRDLDFSQVFDRLLSSQSFPRWYFLLIKTARETFGYQTHVLRFFPFVFAIVASVLSLRLLRSRFGAIPVLFGIAILLNLIPTSWFIYSAFVKQYTFDVFLALLPFCLSDEFYERHLRRGESPGMLVLLALPCALSYTYVIPLLGRLAGWFATTSLAAARRPLVEGRAALTLAGAIAGMLACLYVTDLRFTIDQPGVTNFHSDYILGRDWSRTPLLLQRLAIGWYTGSTEFSVSTGPPMRFLQFLGVFTVIGIARVAFDGFALGRSAPEAPASWGSRSMGSLATICGLILASPIMSYPITEGRMTLFLLVHVQILTLEGLSFVIMQLERKKGARLAAVPLGLVLGLAIAAGLAPAAWRNASGMLVRDSPSNIRGVLPKIHEHRGLPLLVTVCSRKQVESLPEGVGAVEVQHLDFLPDYERDLPMGQAFLMLNAHETYNCRRYLRTVAKVATRKQRLSSDYDSAELWWFEMPPQLPEWAKIINQKTHAKARERKDAAQRDSADE
jgi:hypothetical protein